MRSCADQPSCGREADRKSLAINEVGCSARCLESFSLDQRWRGNGPMCVYIVRD